MTPTTELPSLYSITGDIKDINTVLVNRSELEAARKDAAWQPMETAPKDGRDILVETTSGDVEISSWYEITREGYEPVSDGLYRKVTVKSAEGWSSNYPVRWMPVPAIDSEIAKG